MANAINDSSQLRQELGQAEIAPSAGAVDRAEATAEPEPIKSVNNAHAPPEDLSDGVGAPKQEHSDAPQRSKGKIALIMSALGIAVFLAALDTTIVTTAIPTIAGQFQASQSDYTWIGSSFLLAASAATPVWGKLCDIFGRKPSILSANFIFLIGSLIAALSVNIKMLIAGRVIQGTGGGGLIIMANICISDLFSMRDRGKYFGIIGGVWGIASAVGPILGGIFTEKVSWRWCFYINLPLDGLAFVIILFLLDIETPKTPLLAGLKAVDWIGCITIVSGTVMVLLGLEYGGVSHPWDSAIVVCLIIFGLLTLGIFFINEWRFAKYPIIPLRIFKYRSNIAALGVCFCHGMVFISGAFFLPFYFQAVFGATPILSGVYVFPYVLALSFSSALVGIFIKKTGQYLPAIWFGTVVMTIGFGLFIDLPASRHYWAKVILYQIVAGLGTGPNFQSPLIALQTKVLPKDIATATATFGFVRTLATSIAVVIGGVIFQNGMHKRQDTLRATLGDKNAMELGGAGAGASTKFVQTLPAAEKAVVTRAYTDSLRIMWVFFVCIAAVGVATSLAISKQKLSRQHEVQKTGLAEEEKARREGIRNEDERGRERASVVLGDAEKEKV